MFKSGQKWLPYDLGEGVRIFSVSYNAHVVTSPHDHVSEIAHNLLQTLMNPGYEWQQPIVLIGHSFGGLAGYVSKLLRCSNRCHRGIMDNVQPWQRDMEQLSLDFDDIVNQNKINIYAFCEGKPMENVGILVDFSSAQRSAGYNSYKVEGADHMDVCKPPSKEHPSYRLLLQFIIMCWKKGESECDQALQVVHPLPQLTFGLESYVYRVETLLTSEGKNGAARYVGVWGMGGVWKTLLLQRLVESLKVKGHFEGAMFVWLTVGQTPDMMALYRTLSEELGLKPKKNTNPEDYSRYLNSQFLRKRVFLVLDDVWQVNVFDSLDLAKGDGSVTLFSTRNQSLLERANPHISQVRMTPLSKNDSWSLFCLHAFRSRSNVPSELETLAQSVAEECRGLPLALKVIGRSMFGKSSLEFQWEPLLKKLRESRMKERTVDAELYERLKLGYDLLFEDECRLQDCFLYFAAFPEDSEFVFEGILWCWIGEGLVPARDGDDPRADAFSLINKLWERSFIEGHGEIGLDRWDGRGFKVHDVMRDLAFYILENDCGAPPARQLYFYRAGQNLEVQKSVIQCQKR